MKRRHLYVMMFGVPILLVSALAAMAAFGAAAGLVWLFVVGDNPWPSIADTLLITLLGLVFIISSLALTYRAYALGKEQESLSTLNPRHAWAAVAATTLLLLATAAYQWRIGNIGPPSDDVRCSDFCRDKGFAGSGMPPRNSGDHTCGCYDPQGREAIKMPMAMIPRRQ